MEALIISVLIAGLLLGWLFLMRVEIALFMRRTWKPTAAEQKQATPGVRVVSARYAAPQTIAGAPEVTGTVERKSRETEGGIPRWTLGD